MTKLFLLKFALLISVCIVFSNSAFLSYDSFLASGTDIIRISRETLDNWALASDQQLNDFKNIKDSGLIKKIDKMSTEDLVKIIQEFAQEYEKRNHKELTVSILDDLVKFYHFNHKPATILLEDTEYDQFRSNITEASREKLQNWALACNRYYNLHNYTFVFYGNLSEKIDSMENEHISAFLEICSLKYLSRDRKNLTTDTLDEWVKEYKFDHHPVSPRIGESLTFLSNDLRTEFDHATKERVHNWAIACDRYHHEINFLRVTVALAQKIDTLTIDEVWSYISTCQNDFLSHDSKVLTAEILDKLVITWYISHNHHD